LHEVHNGEVILSVHTDVFHLSSLELSVDFD